MIIYLCCLLIFVGLMATCYARVPLARDCMHAIFLQLQAAFHWLKEVVQKARTAPRSGLGRPVVPVCLINLRPPSIPARGIQIRSNPEQPSRS